MNKLVAQLKKELKRSPGKAVALGGGTLVAVWFWFPLVTEWFGGDPANPHSATAAAALPATAPLAVDLLASAAPTAELPSIDWRSLSAWKQHNSFARPFAWQAGMRNPFVAKVIEINNPAVDAAEQQPAAEQQLTREVAAQQLAEEFEGLQLTSTLITPRGRSATINGVNYRLGDPIALESSRQEAVATGDFPAAAAPEIEATPNQFVLVNIEPESVTLQAGTQFYPLKMKRPANRAIRLELR